MSTRAPISGLRTLITGVVVAGCAVLALSGCSATELSSSTGSTPETTIPGQNGTDDGGDVDFDAEIGDCVELGGTTMNAEIDHAECGGDDSNYKVVAKAPTQDGCPSDVDNVYYVTQAGVEQGALCLDIDWVVDTCLTIPSAGMDEPSRSPCEPGKPDTVRVLAVLPGTTDDSGCPAEATSVYTYEERQLVTCVTEV